MHEIRLENPPVTADLAGARNVTPRTECDEGLQRNLEERCGLLRSVHLDAIARQLGTHGAGYSAPTWRMSIG